RLENLYLFASNRDHKLLEAHGTPVPIWPKLSQYIMKAEFGASRCLLAPLLRDVMERCLLRATQGSRSPTTSVSPRALSSSTAGVRLLSPRLSLSFSPVSPSPRKPLLGTSSRTGPAQSTW